MYKTYDPDKFSEESARWAIDFVDNLLYLKWQEAIKDLRAVRDPMEASFFENQPLIEKKALELFKENPDKARKFLTDLEKNQKYLIIPQLKISVKNQRDPKEVIVTIVVSGFFMEEGTKDKKDV